VLKKQISVTRPLLCVNTAEQVILQGRFDCCEENGGGLITNGTEDSNLLTI